MIADILFFALTFGVIAIFIFPLAAKGKTPWPSLLFLTVAGLCFVIAGLAFLFVDDMGPYKGFPDVTSLALLLFVPLIIMWNLCVWLGAYLSALLWLVFGVLILRSCWRGGWYRIALVFHNHS